MREKMEIYKQHQIIEASVTQRCTSLNKNVQILP